MHRFGLGGFVFGVILGVLIALPVTVWFNPWSQAAQAPTQPQAKQVFGVRCDKQNDAASCDYAVTKYQVDGGDSCYVAYATRTEAPLALSCVTR